MIKLIEDRPWRVPGVMDPESGTFREELRTRVTLELDDEGRRFITMVARAWEGRRVVRLTEHVTRAMLDVAELNLVEEVERTLRLRLQGRMAERGMTALAVTGPHRQELEATHSVQFTLLALCLPMLAAGEGAPEFAGLTIPPPVEPPRDHCGDADCDRCRSGSEP